MQFTPPKIALVSKPFGDMAQSVEAQAATDQRLLLVIAAQAAEKALNNALAEQASAVIESANKQTSIEKEKLATANTEVAVAEATLKSITHDLNKNGEAEVKVAIHRVSTVIDALECERTAEEQAPVSVWEFGEAAQIRETRLKDKTRLQHLRDELHRLRKILDALNDMQRLPVSASHLKSMVVELLTTAGIPDPEMSAEAFIGDQLNALAEQFSAIASEIFSHGR